MKTIVKNMKSFLAVIFATLLFLAGAGCQETREGAEEDLENAGEAVEETAEDAADAVEDAADEAEDAVDDATTNQPENEPDRPQ